VNNPSSPAVAVIPVREGSQRVLDKNFRSFAGGKSLLELKIEQLRKEACFEEIFVSSDSARAREVAERTSVGFLPRESRLCSANVRWSDVISGVVASLPGDNPLVAWVHSTSPLHTEYARPLSVFRKREGECDSLVTVSAFQEFIVNKKGRPINYHWGVWHDYSQELDELYKVTGALFIARKQDILQWRYLIGVKPHLYSVNRKSAVDIDTMEDFELAQLLYLDHRQQLRRPSLFL